MNEDQKVGGGCQCGCCGDTGEAVEVTSPPNGADLLVQLSDASETPETASSTDAV